jgi:hypothetical protein
MVDTYLLVHMVIGLPYTFGLSYLEKRDLVTVTKPKKYSDSGTVGVI